MTTTTLNSHKVTVTGMMIVIEEVMVIGTVTVKIIVISYHYLDGLLTLAPVLLLTLLSAANATTSATTSATAISSHYTQHMRGEQLVGLVERKRKV